MTKWMLCFSKNKYAKTTWHKLWLSIRSLRTLNNGEDCFLELVLWGVVNAISCFCCLLSLENLIDEHNLRLQILMLWMMCHPTSQLRACFCILSVRSNILHVAPLNEKHIMQTVLPYTPLNVYACFLCAEAQSELDGCLVPVLISIIWVIFRVNKQKSFTCLLKMKHQTCITESPIEVNEGRNIQSH